jgi:hypothetical protein
LTCQVDSWRKPMPNFTSRNHGLSLPSTCAMPRSSRSGTRLGGWWRSAGATRCLSWSPARHRGRLWLTVSLYNFVMPHKSLRQGHTPRTPALAIGLSDHVWSYREYIGVPVPTDPVLAKQMDERMSRLLIPALQDQPVGGTQTPPAGKTNGKEATPLPKAA